MVSKDYVKVVHCVPCASSETTRLPKFKAVGAKSGARRAQKDGRHSIFLAQDGVNYHATICTFHDKAHSHRPLAQDTGNIPALAIPQRGVSSKDPILNGRWHC